MDSSNEIHERADPMNSSSDDSSMETQNDHHRSSESSDAHEGSSESSEAHEGSSESSVSNHNGSTEFSASNHDGSSESCTLMDSDKTNASITCEEISSRNDTSTTIRQSFNVISNLMDTGNSHESEDMNVDFPDQSSSQENYTEEIMDNYSCVENNDESDSDDGDLEDDGEQISLKELLELLKKRTANTTADVNVVVSEVEMLLGILKIADHHSLPISFVADICGLFNSFFDKPILPASRHKLDKLFNPGNQMKYHAICSDCKTYVREYEKSEKRLFCKVCNKNFTIDPSYRDYFVTFNVVPELKHLLENNQEYYIELMNSLGENDTMKDFYNGRKYMDILQSLSEEDRKAFITLTFNSDGSPVWKSSKCSIWPVQININELPPKVKCQNTTTYALWFGRDKPNMNIFLSAFVKEINKLSKNGFNCRMNNQNKTIKVFAVCCCVDSVARAPMQNIIQFNGYFGCNWCLHKGVRVPDARHGVVKYPLLAEMPQLRSEEQTLFDINIAISNRQKAKRDKQETHGMKGASPLLILDKFNIITGFVPDAMHCIDLGVARQFADLWFDSVRCPYSISNRDIRSIDKFVRDFKVPTQLARLSRSIYDRKFWKAKEWQNWLLYYSLPIMKQISGFSRYAEHWSKLVEASHLLLSESIDTDELIRADNLLSQFVNLTEVLYSKEAMTFNVHQLLHIKASVGDWGPLWSHWGYPFENGNGKLVKMIHAANGVISQICRSISIQRSSRVVEQHVSCIARDSPVLQTCRNLEVTYTKKSLKIGSNRYFGKPCCLIDQNIEHPNLQINLCKAYKKSMLNGCIFKSCIKKLRRSDNSYAQMENGKYIRIIQFVVTNNSEEYTLCNVVQTHNSLMHDCSSLRTIRNIADEVSVVETRSIKKLCVLLEIGNKRIICAVPNMYWYS